MQIDFLCQALQYLQPANATQSSATAMCRSFVLSPDTSLSKLRMPPFRLTSSALQVAPGPYPANRSMAYLFILKGMAR